MSGLDQDAGNDPRSALGMDRAEVDGDSGDAERWCALPGDTFIADARAQVTHGVTIDAPASAVWPLVLDMVRDESSAPMAAGRPGSYAVLVSDEPRALVLGGLYDHDAKRYLAFDAARPPHFWQATWALVLHPLGEHRTRLLVRSRVAATTDAVRWSSLWLHPFHDFMDHGVLTHLKDRAEGHAARALRDRVVESLRGAARRLAEELRLASR
jgi:hypothetical protein